MLACLSSLSVDTCCLSQSVTSSRKSLLLCCCFFPIEIRAKYIDTSAKTGHNIGTLCMCVYRVLFGGWGRREDLHPPPPLQSCRSPPCPLSLQCCHSLPPSLQSCHSLPPSLQSYRFPPPSLQSCHSPPLLFRAVIPLPAPPPPFRAVISLPAPLPSELSFPSPFRNVFSESTNVITGVSNVHEN